VFPGNARVDYAMIMEFPLQMADLIVCISTPPLTATKQVNWALK